MEDYLKFQNQNMENMEKDMAPCDICLESFPKDLLKHHVSTHVPVMCNVCEQTFPNIIVLNVHLHAHIVGYLISCNVCHISLPRHCLKFHNKAHIDTDENQIPWQKTFMTDYINYYESKGRNITRECNICKISFTDRKDLTNHLYSHIGRNLVACDLCPKTFSKDYLKYHRLTHIVNKSHMCDVCQKTFPHIDFLKKHLYSHMGGNLVLCNVCEKPVSKKYLRCHLRTHVAQKPHVCIACQKSFACSTTFLKNLNSCIGDYPGPCDICQKSFSKDYLKHYQHHLTHTRKKLHVCDFCQKSFPHIELLKKHLYSHMEGNLVLCNVCEKPVSKRYLRCHLGTHVTQKLRVCNACQKSFACSTSLLKNPLNFHIEEHLGPCDVCLK